MPDGSLEARLVGDGNVSGSGLPLPDAFTAIAEHLLDNKFATFAELNDVVAHVMRLKTDRIMALWFTWEDFTRALITKMIESNVLVREFGQDISEFDYYHLADDFKMDEHHVVLKKSGIGFTARNEATRQRLYHDSGLLQTLKAAQAQWSEANFRALKDVQNAIDSLEVLVGSKPPERVKRVRVKRPPDQVRPTARELGERRYGLNGNAPDPKIRGAGFAADGLRSCNKCHKPLPPEAYERNLYWQGSHNQNWFLRGSCDDCYDHQQEIWHEDTKKARKQRRALERGEVSGS